DVLGDLQRVLGELRLLRLEGLHGLGVGGGVRLLLRLLGRRLLLGAGAARRREAAAPRRAPHPRPAEALPQGAAREGEQRRERGDGEGCPPGVWGRPPSGPGNAQCEPLGSWMRSAMSRAAASSGSSSWVRAARSLTATTPRVTSSSPRIAQSA